MSSDSETTARFDEIDWSSERDVDDHPRVSGRVIGFLITTSVVVLLASYESLAVENTDAFLFGWQPTAVNWLFLVSLAVFGWFLVYPLLRDRSRLTQYWQQLRGEPIALASAVYLVAFFIVGLLGLTVVSTQDTGLTDAYQPPMFFSVSDHVPSSCVGVTSGGVCHGSWQYPLGTNAHGDGILELVALGAGVSLQVAFIVGALVVPIALLVGVLAGYVGGRTDTVLMRYVDVQQTVPAFLVYIISIYVFGRSLFMLVLVFGLLSWGGVARVVRSEVLQLRSRGYVMAAINHGAGNLSVLRRHVLPNVSGNLAVTTTQQIPRILLAEAAISFMLLNDINVPSWGHTMTMGLRHQHQFTHTWWISTFPVLFLALTVVSLAVVGDFFRDALDPTTE